jgi:hypothetical protein
LDSYTVVLRPIAFIIAVKAAIARVAVDTVMRVAVARVGYVVLLLLLLLLRPVSVA